MVTLRDDDECDEVLFEPPNSPAAAVLLESNDLARWYQSDTGPIDVELLQDLLDLEECGRRVSWPASNDARTAAAALRGDQSSFLSSFLNYSSGSSSGNVGRSVVTNGSSH